MSILQLYARHAGHTDSGVILAADVGGTKANLAIFKRRTDGGLDTGAIKRFATHDYKSFDDVLREFIKGMKEKPDAVSIGVAGPVVDGKAEFTNLDWKINETEVAKVTGAQRVSIINDLEASAWGLAMLGPEDILTLQEGSPDHEGNVAVIAPGTGLGEAGLFFDGKAHRPFATEGGHAGFGPRDEEDIALLKWLQKGEEVVSWEHVIAGPAIHHIYRFLVDARGMKENLHIEGDKDPSAAISQAALKGKGGAAEEAMRLFVKYLAWESANLALKMKSTGGLFIGGGIPPRIRPLLQKEQFLADFRDCGRMQDLVSSVPVHLVLEDKTALLGAAYYAAFVA